MSERKFFYTNLSDSVIFAEFKGHQYCMQNDCSGIVSDLYKETLTKFLTLVNDDDNSDIGVILTLNQICDNRFLNFENQEKNFKLLSELITKGRLKISYFGEYDIVSYTLNALKNCIKRLSKGNTSPDMVYVSSLFPELGIDNGDSVSRSRLRLMLGYDPTYVKYIKDDVFELNNGKTVDLSHFEEQSAKKNQYGLYTALKKYADNPEESDWLTSQNLWTLDKIGTLYVITWVKNLVELNNLAKQHDALIKNVDFSGERTLKKILSCLLDNEDMLNEKLDFWLGSTKNQKAVKNGIKEILKKLTEDSNRTAMYIKIKDYMNEFAENNKNDEDLSKRFSTVTTNQTKRLPYQRVFFTILNIVDYAYNLLNMFFSTSECTIVEGLASFKFQGGRFITNGTLNISAMSYGFDEAGNLKASESDNPHLNEMIEKLILLTEVSYLNGE